MMTFHLRLKRISKPEHTRLKFDLEKLKDPNVLETSQAMIDGKFAFLIIMYSEDTDVDTVITTFNTAVTSSDWNSQWDPWQTSSEEKTVGHCRNSWSVQQKVSMRNKRLEPEGFEKYKEVNNNIKRYMKKAKKKKNG